MRLRWGIRGVLWALVCAPATVAAQHAHAHGEPAEGALAAQIESVRRATAKYRDVEQAKADGFVRFGRHEGALMGEHWFRRDLADQPLDLERPSTLQYATIDGRRVLVGVAYSAYQRPGEPMPEGFAGDADAWHAHDVSRILGVLTEGRPLLRRVVARQQQRRGTPPTRGRTHLVMLHAWVWLDNPDGVFALHHRALPYLRAGLPASWASGGDLDAAHGVALLGAHGCRDELRATHLLARLDREQRRQLGSRCAAAAATIRTFEQSAGAPALNQVAAREWRGYLTLRDALLSPAQKERLGSVIEHGQH